MHECTYWCIVLRTWAAVYMHIFISIYIYIYMLHRVTNSVSLRHSCTPAPYTNDSHSTNEWRSHVAVGDTQSHSNPDAPACTTHLHTHRATYIHIYMWIYAYILLLKFVTRCTQMRHSHTHTQSNITICIYVNICIYTAAQVCNTTHPDAPLTHARSSIAHAPHTISIIWGGFG